MTDSATLALDSCVGLLDFGENELSFFMTSLKKSFVCVLHHHYETFRIREPASTCFDSPSEVIPSPRMAGQTTLKELWRRPAPRRVGLQTIITQQGVQRSTLTKKPQLISLHFVILVISRSLALSPSFIPEFLIDDVSLVPPPPPPPSSSHPSPSLSNSLCCISAFILLFISF